jgi:hypothetical protein
MSRVLICGSRDFSDKRLLMTSMEAVEARGPITCVIEGGARGADRIGRAWARWKGLPVLTVEADWDFYKKGAGPIRNKWMLDLCKPDIVVAFPLTGPGTYDMMAQARAAGVEVLECSRSDPPSPAPQPTRSER